ncbi:uncharacterized protein LOC119074091 [Bradysia coprophila]|uniref:uncharacterized protein LOC119074091 n=1 Tax=Bradysia coprophila TaxID=38358 RepID=UPI00187D8B8E|nr:uncharacterized protein LOC119074091 [Bradysia coprophila]
MKLLGLLIGMLAIVASATANSSQPSSTTYLQKLVHNGLIANHNVRRIKRYSDEENTALFVGIIPKVTYRSGEVRSVNLSSIVPLARERISHLTNKRCVIDGPSVTPFSIQIQRDFNYLAEQGRCMFLREFNNFDDYYQYYYKFGKPIMKMVGSDHKFRGEIGLDAENEKIIFFGNNITFGGGSSTEIFATIVIKNQKDEQVKTIHLFSTQNMLDIIRAYDLKNGISYEYGFVIEVSMAKSNLIHFKINESNDYHQNGTLTKRKFIIISDVLLSYEFYEQQYLKLLTEWQDNFEYWTNNLNFRASPGDSATEIEKKRKEWKQQNFGTLLDKIHSLHQDIQIIQNSDHIRDLQNKVHKLKNEITLKFEEVHDLISNLKSRVDIMKLSLDTHTSNSNGASCSSAFGIISPISSLVPVAGAITSAITAVIGAACAIAGH